MFEEVFGSVFVGSLAALALAALLLALGAWAYPRLKREKQGYPYEDDVESVILPLIYDAIHTVHEMTIQRLNELGEEMDGVQKQALFAELYRVLVRAAIKRFISQDQWVEWGQQLYDSGRGVMIDFGAHLGEKLAEWEAQAQANAVEGASG